MSIFYFFIFPTICYLYTDHSAENRLIRYARLNKCGTWSYFYKCLFSWKCCLFPMRSFLPLEKSRVATEAGERQIYFEWNYGSTSMLGAVHYLHLVFGVGRGFEETKRKQTKRWVGSNLESGHFTLNVNNEQPLTMKHIDVHNKIYL